ncbi:Fusaric acid resistance protein-like [Tistlia consotensis]|uniref:Fusaric acid resistance protein-like n=1 Tax=Tistlia consotensis USBA 355 TaxID=560819 RepID=A0A1Y6CK58_9PROT|nr:FUSC family protein [Tistlia consotensis]SMF71849.1 Fusaric acid resistance protein-like [Tistlia consotensis USBA 355]SNS06117.1 Fusaric acid resistance protein-like [Tistlia consotensis]
MPALDRRQLLPALRLVAAALLAYGLSTLAGLPEGYWAALSAVIVSRPQPGAALQAGADRLVGTLLGAGIACLAALAGQVPFFAGPWSDLLLLGAALLPLGLLLAWREAWRTAPIAAIIVLSAGTRGEGALGAALLRVLEIGLGGLVAVAVARFLLPGHSDREAAVLARRLLARSAAALAAAEAGDEAGCSALQAEARALQRRLFRLPDSARWERVDRAALAELVRAAGRFGLSCGFAVRLLLAARRAGNPALAGAALKARLAPLTALAREEAEVPAAPAGRASAESQAAALGHVLALAARDAGALAEAIGGDRFRP